MTGPSWQQWPGSWLVGRLLLVFDDFEQNLAPGGEDFLDPAIGEIMTALPGAARTGALLVTCRYPLPGPDRFLVQVPIPALSPAELRRLFLRLPALARLGPADRHLVTRAIGGHPRLIEFTDALLRGGHSKFMDGRNHHAQMKDALAQPGHVLQARGHWFDPSCAHRPKRPGQNASLGMSGRL